MITTILSTLLATAHAQPTSCEAFLEVALSAAKVGITMAQDALAAGDFSRERKLDGSLVTAADLAVSQRLVELLGEATGLPVFSEESVPPSVDELMKWPRFWVIDPIDGTENFARSGNDFSILIALVERDASGLARPLLGVIGRPAENDLYWGSVDRGSWKLDLDRPDQPPRRLLSARNEAGAPSATTQLVPQAKIRNSRLEGAFAFERVGGNGAKFIAISDGRVDCYLAQPMKWWDIAAGDALYRYSVGDGEAPRPSPLAYVPHARTKLFFQELGFILGECRLDAEAQREILHILDHARIEK